MLLVFLLYFLTFIFFLNEKRLKVHAAIISSFLTAGLVAAGHISSREVYSGFSDNAVVTVVLMLIMTGILERSGVIKLLVHWVTKFELMRSRITLSLFTIVVISSAVMNDVGALAIILPGALVICQRMRIPPATILMPLSFGALLGGLLTKVGTPPNIIIADFRESEVGTQFEMFDYTPVGVVVCIVGGITILLLRKRIFSDSRYHRLSEKTDHPLSRGYIPLLIGKDSPLIGKKIGASKDFTSSFVFPTVLLRNVGEKWQGFYQKPWDINLELGNVLVVRVDPSQVEVQRELIEDFIAMGYFSEVPDEVQDEICAQLMHICSIDRKSPLLKNESIGFAFRERFNLLRLKDEDYFLNKEGAEEFYEGQVMTFLGESRNFKSLLDHYRLIELDEPQVSIEWPRFRRALMIFGSAILLGACSIVRLELALGLALLIFLSIREVTWEQINKSIDIPLVVLIATMLVNAKAFSTTGAAGLLADTFVSLVPQNPVILLWGVIGVTIVLTNIISNAACAAMMAPVGLSLARSLEISPDPYLMGICVGSSCAFLTPIGHQCNMLVYKVGHYDFISYFKLGIWVSLTVWIAASVSIPLFWEF
jgi:di/tricarboxylate transporter